MGTSHKTFVVLGSAVLLVIVLAGWGLKAMLTRPKSPQEVMQEYARQAQSQAAQMQSQMQSQMMGIRPNVTSFNNSTSSNQAAAAIPLPPPAFTIKGDAMAQDFRSGKLPSPLSQPTGPAEQAAAELAPQIPLHGRLARAGVIEERIEATPDV